MKPSDSNTRPTLLLLFLLALFGAAVLPSFGQWRTETFNLVEGWQGIYIRVDPGVAASIGRGSVDLRRRLGRHLGAGAEHLLRRLRQVWRTQWKQGQQSQTGRTRSHFGSNQMNSVIQFPHTVLRIIIPKAARSSGW